MATYSLEVTQMLVSSSKYNIKCPYSMTPTEITFHNTANDASAMSEISYMIGNNNQVSFHEAVDDYRVVQGIPHTRNAWHSGDGANGTGNRKSIGIECCYSKSGGERYEKAFDNALTRIAMLMKQYNISKDKIYYHKDRSGKNCPHRTIANGITIAQFREKCQARYDEMYKTTSSTTSNKTTVTTATTTGTIHKVGETVTITGVYTSSGSNKKLTPAKTKGKITKVVKGARNPYLLENGNIGWVNDSCIKSTSTSTTSSNTSTTSSKTLKVGASVKIKKGAKDLNTKKTFASFVYNTTYIVISISGDTVIFGKGKVATGKVSKSNVTVV